MTAAQGRDRFLVLEMIHHLEVVEAISKRGRTSLFSSAESRYAIAHAIELLSVAAKHLGAKFKSANPEVRWASLVGLRRAIAHPYDLDAESTDFESIWRFALDESPKLKSQLSRVRYPPS